MATVQLAQLLEAGVHFGHKANRWNPKMADFIYGHRNGIHIIDLQKTAVLLKQALSVINKFASEHKNILFIGFCIFGLGLYAQVIIKIGIELYFLTNSMIFLLVSKNLLLSIVARL